MFSRGAGVTRCQQKLQQNPTAGSTQMQHNIIISGTGVVASVNPRGFGFLAYSRESAASIRVYFHLADSDGTDLQIGDRVEFALGFDPKNRPRAYNVRFIERPSASTTASRVRS
jgi:hypothetical protein